MPKLKTHKATSKRIHITAGGKIMHAHQGRSHLRLAKAKRVKKTYGKLTELRAPLRKLVKRLLPYGA